MGIFFYEEINLLTTLNKRFSEIYILVIRKLEFLIDSIFVMFSGCISKTVGIPMDTNCAPLLFDLRHMKGF